MAKRGLWLVVVLFLPLALGGCIASLPGLLGGGDGGGIGTAGYEFIPGRFIITFAEPYPSAAEMEAAVVAAGGTVESVMPEIGLVVAESKDKRFAETLRGNPAVEAVVNDMKVQWIPEKPEVKSEEGLPEPEAVPDFPANWAFQWDKRIIQADKAWAITTGNPNVTIAILDTGIDYNTLDLRKAGKIDFARSTSFATVDHPYIDASCPPEDRFGIGIIFDLPCPGEPYWIDLHFHGTWVAGIAAASGEYRVIGVAPDVTLIAVKVLSRFGWGYFSWIINGIYYAASVGADVANMSLGPSEPIPLAEPGVMELVAAITRAINYAMAQGTLVVDATGNSDLNADLDPTKFYENAQYAYAAIGTSATGPTDLKAFYSNYGRLITDLAAPGGDYAPIPGSGYVYGPCTRYYCDDLLGPHPVWGSGGWIAGGFGTSAAAPQVSGVAALIDSLYGGTAPGGVLQARLRQSADDLGDPGIDAVYGWGRVNAYKAVTMP
jgi:subtilisin family serine protease